MGEFNPKDVAAWTQADLQTELERNGCPAARLLGELFVRLASRIFVEREDLRERIAEAEQIRKEREALQAARQLVYPGPEAVDDDEADNEDNSMVRINRDIFNRCFVNLREAGICTIGKSLPDCIEELARKVDPDETVMLDRAIAAMKASLGTFTAFVGGTNLAECIEELAQERDALRKEHKELQAKFSLVLDAIRKFEIKEIKP